jgi:hypothetical protein
MGPVRSVTYVSGRASPFAARHSGSRETPDFAQRFSRRDRIDIKFNLQPKYAHADSLQPAGDQNQGDRHEVIGRKGFDYGCYRLQQRVKAWSEARIQSLQAPHSVRSSGGCITGDKAVRGPGFLSYCRPSTRKSSGLPARNTALPAIMSVLADFRWISSFHLSILPS